MNTLDSTIEVTIDLKDHLCSEGFPRVNFASLIERSKTPSNSVNSNGPLPLPSENQNTKIDISRQMDLAQSRKTYKGIREQDFHEVAQGYDSDDSFVDDSEAHEDLAPFETKLEHGTFYVNFGKVVFSDLPHESSEDLSNFNPPSPKMKTKSDKDTSSDKLKRSSCIIEHDGYLITPPKKSSKKRKDSFKFSPKMVLKRSKSFKGPQQESEIEPIFIEPIPIINKTYTPQKSNENMPQKSNPQQPQPTEEIPIHNTQPQKVKKPQQSTTKQTGKQLKSPNSTPPVDTNTLLLTKLSDGNLLTQMDLTPECFTPAFYEKNDIHKFASQIPDSLATVLQLFFNHIQAKSSIPINLNSPEYQFKRCLILGRVYAFLKRRQDPSLTQVIQNYLEHFFSIKFHSFELILDTILKTIQSAIIYSPLETLISNIQPYIDRISEISTDSQEDKQNACRKRFKWSNGLKQLLGNAILAQIELEKAGFGICAESLSNEQIIIQFLNTFVLPCWPKGKMKVSKLYKVTQQYHEHFTADKLNETVHTQSNATPQNKTTSTPPPTTITKTTTTVSPTNSNVGIYPHVNPEINSSTITTQAKLNESHSEKLPKKPIYSPVGKIISPNSKLGSPKSLSSHPNLLNPELIPVAAQMSLSTLAAKKSPLIKLTQDMHKFREKSPKPKQDITIRKSPTVIPLPSYSCELDVKPVIPHIKRDMMPTCLIPGQSMHPNLLLSAGSALFANNYNTPIAQSSEHIPSFNIFNAPNFGQNFAVLQTFPETIIHLKPGSKETSPKNAKSHTPTP